MPALRSPCLLLLLLQLLSLPQEVSSQGSQCFLTKDFETSYGGIFQAIAAPAGDWSQTYIPLNFLNALPGSGLDTYGIALSGFGGDSLVIFNPTCSNDRFTSTLAFPSQQIVLSMVPSGTNPEMAGVLFIAPATGTYSVSGTFTAIDSQSEGQEIECRVYSNGVLVYDFFFFFFFLLHVRE